MLKKMMLLAGFALAAIAFAAPAANAETLWTDLEGNPLGEEGVPFESTPTPITSTTGGALKTTSTITLKGELFNGSMGEGIVTSGTAGAGTTTLPGCEAVVTLSNFNWGITLTTAESTSEPNIDISNVTFTNHFNHACQTFGVPPKVPASGTVTGDIYNTATSVCIKLLGGDMNVETPEGPGPAVTLSLPAGDACIHGFNVN